MLGLSCVCECRHQLVVVEEENKGGGQEVSESNVDRGNEVV